MRTRASQMDVVLRDPCHGNVGPSCNRISVNLFRELPSDEGTLEISAVFRVNFQKLFQRIPAVLLNSDCTGAFRGSTGTMPSELRNS
jgi:hypothetical protein